MRDNAKDIGRRIFANFH